MSNHRCNICGKQGDWRHTAGLCVECSDIHDMRQRKLENQNDQEFNAFLDLPDSEKWRLLWDAMLGIKK